ncbi:FHA domain-containing protein [Chondromyces apiculatus]|uniref:FHA domain-containing protein n=1 Tax=Chondromyces apiculatus DSM 436 TaxID=1192034 RepID=A0A017TI89_9BACT|nr:FHA domain-containing protein [Chondromyces apiculatus]EYF08351.1 Hypothetical protein CAP_4967 [Chondromyces apiculatus DSM 436]
MSHEISRHRGSRDDSTPLGRSRHVPLRHDPPLAPRNAFLVAHDRLQVLAQIARGPAVVAVAVAPDGRVVDSALVEDGRALLMGRHSRCGLRLSSPMAALRQLAVLVRKEENAMVTRVWDLDTGVPFITEDGQRNAAVIADGPLYFSVHGYGIWLVPADLSAGWSGRAQDTWEALPGRVFVDRRPPGRGTQAPGEASARFSPGSTPHNAEEISHVTGVGAPLVLGDPDSIEIGWGTLRLSHRGRRLRHEVSAERLERGVLIGRYERCGLEIKAEPEISRVHALLVKIGADVWAIDAASTNGLWRGDMAVRAEPLRHDDTLRLGRTVTLQWTRRELAEA